MPLCGVFTPAIFAGRSSLPARQRLGLYACTVVPRAPNFCALRRVSSNFERAYVSTSWPVSIRSKP
jgi:hypothetical protein